MPGLERWLQGSIIVHQPKVCNSKSQQNVIAWFEGLSCNRDTLCQLPSQQKITDIERPHPAARNDSGFSFCKHLISISAFIRQKNLRIHFKAFKNNCISKDFSSSRCQEFLRCFFCSFSIGLVDYFNDKKVHANYAELSL